MRVVAVCVTWNRKDDVCALIADALSQGTESVSLELIVVDNASTDGTRDAITSRFECSRTFEGVNFLENTMIGRGSSPAITPGPLTYIQTAENLGGCGGFNIGMLHAREDAKRHGAPDALWLLDDDARLAHDTLAKLSTRLRQHQSLGAVGARMADPEDHSSTLESTVFFNRDTGLFGPAPEPSRDHVPLIDYDEKLRRVDVIAASCLLARWEAFEQVGIWDNRFFIAGDDAEWCLRIAEAGWDLAADLDAVHFHKPWHTKVNIRREYCRKRNLIWIWERHLPSAKARELTSDRFNTWLDAAQRQLSKGKYDESFLSALAVYDASTSAGGPPPERPESGPPEESLEHLINAARDAADRYLDRLDV